MPYTDSDIAVSILEHFFEEEINFQEVTRPIPGRLTCRKASAINHMKRHVAARLGIPCHKVPNCRDKHTKLTKAIDEALDEAEALSTTHLDYVIPEKKEEIQPINITVGVSNLESQMREVVERLNMADNDFRLIETDQIEELKTLRKARDAVGTKFETLSGKNNLKINPSSISKICYTYCPNAELADELEDLMYEMYEIFKEIKGNERAKAATQDREYNFKTEVERNKAILQNQIWKEKYECRKQEIKEQKQMYQAEVESQYLRLLSNHEDNVSRIERHNAQEKDRYRKELNVLARWNRQQANAVQDHEAAVQKYIEEHRRTELTVTDLDIVQFLYSMREIIRVNRNLRGDIKRFGTVGSGVTHAWNKQFVNQEGNLISTRDVRVADCVHFRKESMTTILMIEEGNVTFQGLTVPELYQRCAEKEISHIVANVIIAARWMISGTTKNKGWDCLTFSEAEAMLRLTTPAMEEPRPNVTKPQLKTPPAPPNKSRLLEKAEAMTPVPKYKSALKLKQKTYPAYREISKLSLGDIEDFDYFSLLYSAMYLNPSYGKKTAELLFGPRIPFRYYSFCNKHFELLEATRGIIWDIISDWMMNMDPTKKNLIIAVSAKKKYLHDKYIRRKAAISQSMSESQPRKYRMRTTKLLTENDRKEILQRQYNSLKKSNDFHRGNHRDGIRLKSSRPKAIKTKLKQLNYVTVKNWDLLDDVEILGCEPQSFETQSGWESRLRIRHEARKAVECLGRCNLNNVPTHMIENMLYASSKLGFLPKLDISRLSKGRLYWRRSRIALSYSISTARE